MKREDLLRLVILLGKAFAARGMTAQVKDLRLYYGALRGNLGGTATALEKKWPELVLVEWLKTLRVPPYDRAYRVRPWGSRCACPREKQRLFTAVVFPGGAKVACASCNEVWLQEEARAASSWSH